MNQIAVQKQSTVRDYTASQMSLIRKTVAADTNATEFDLFFEMCRRYGLDPFKKQIYAIVTNKHKQDKRKLVVVTAIDGYRSIAARAGNYRPDENEPEYHYRQELKDPASNPLGLEKAVVTVYQQDSRGEWHPIKASAYWDEFAPVIENGRWVDNRFEGDGTFKLDPKKDNWRKMARVMLAKCAEAQALRKGWPEDLGGLYVAEEMDQATSQMSASELAEQADVEDRMKRINHGKAIAFQFDPQEPLKYVPISEVFSTIERWLHDEQPIAAKVDWFNRTNAESLREYWAFNATDALETKKQLENQMKKEQAA